MKRSILILMLFIALHTTVLFPFTASMKNKPFAEKVGYVPEPAVLRALSVDQYRLVAASLISRVISYYGGLIDQLQNKIALPPEYYGMYKILDTAVKLDHYNMDAYYFSQAVLVWGAGQVKVTTDLLEYGMKYRTWDYYLPYFAGFDYAFFLKDYEKAAGCYQKAAQLTGSDVAIGLAGRYMHESGRTALAVNYLTEMVKGASSPSIKKSLSIRLQAFREVVNIDNAARAYRQRYNRHPRTVAELVQKGFLLESPRDPYGGDFYFDENGVVHTTSQFKNNMLGKTNSRE